MPTTVVETYENGVLVSSETVEVAPELANADTIRHQAAQALAANRAFIADANVTTAEAVAQTKALSRQMNGVIRLLLNQLDGTD